MWKHFQRRKSVPVEVGAASHAVVAEVFLGLFWAIVLPRVWPQQVAHRPECRWFLKSVQLSRETQPWLHLLSWYPAFKFCLKLWDQTEGKRSAVLHSSIHTSLLFCFSQDSVKLKYVKRLVWIMDPVMLPGSIGASMCAGPVQSHPFFDSFFLIVMSVSSGCFHLLIITAHRSLCAGSCSVVCPI